MAATGAFQSHTNFRFCLFLRRLCDSRISSFCRLSSKTVPLQVFKLHYAAAYVIFIDSCAANAISVSIRYISKVMFGKPSKNSDSNRNHDVQVIVPLIILFIFLVYSTVTCHFHQLYGLARIFPAKWTDGERYPPGRSF